VGKAIAAKVVEIVESGKLAQLEQATGRMPPEMVELATRPRLDPKIVLRAYKKLGISSLAELRQRLERGEVRSVLGERVAFHIQLGLDERPRMLLWDAEPIAWRIEAGLAKLVGVTQVARVGSLRRRQETVGDLGFLLAAERRAAIIEQIGKLPDVKLVESPGKTPALFQHSSGVQLSVSVTTPAEWGLALVNATGSREHLKQLKAHAKRRQVSLAARSLVQRKVKLADEAAVYRAAGLRFIEPELREGRGEIEAAAMGRLPNLVTVADLRGDLHMHTAASDGRNTMAEMVAASKERGYAYVAITDHSQSLKITNGLSEKRLLAQCKAIDRLNRRLRGITVLKSAEVDILEDGSLDYSDAVLKELDFTVCSIHSKFSLSREQQTERLMRAMDNPYFNVLGHATGRLLLKRAGYGVDMERVLEHAKQNGCCVEINSSPDRLDLSDEHARLAKELGIPIAVNTDAHSLRELEFIHSGIKQARRAWLEAADVLNTLPLAKLRRALQR
jgi:DNA polymerase (family 10)